MSDKAIKTGQCLCGNISYKLKSDPQMTVLCHCKNCQRQAGSVLSIIAGVPQGDVEISGEVKTYNDSGDSGGDVLRQFCPECGSPMFTLADQAPGLIFIKRARSMTHRGLNPRCNSTPRASSIGWSWMAFPALKAIRLRHRAPLQTAPYTSFENEP